MDHTRKRESNRQLHRSQRYLLSISCRSPSHRHTTTKSRRTHGFDHFRLPLGHRSRRFGTSEQHEESRRTSDRRSQHQSIPSRTRKLHQRSLRPSQTWTRTLPRFKTHSTPQAEFRRKLQDRHDRLRFTVKFSLRRDSQHSTIRQSSEGNQDEGYPERHLGRSSRRSILSTNYATKSRNRTTQSPTHYSTRSFGTQRSSRG